nr:tubulin monoglycylase TTLL3 isoform X2 [Nothobranchius furzeri]
MEPTGSGRSVHLSQETNGHGSPHQSAHPKVKASLPDLHPGTQKSAKALAVKAIKMHKIFSIQGPYPVIRAALRARGWVEQPLQCSKQPRQSRGSRSSSNDVCTSDDDNTDYAEREQEHDELHSLVSHYVQNEMVYFYWLNRRNAIDTTCLQKKQIINHFARTDSFTTKVGLCMNLRNLHWFATADPDTFFPRCYKLTAEDERHAFIEDYRRTACTSLLKYTVEQGQSEETNPNSQSVQGQRNGKNKEFNPLPLSQMVNSALVICHEYLGSLEHSDIDTNTKSFTEKEWTEFLNSYYLFVHGRAQTKISEDLFSCCKAMLQRLEKVSPQLSIGGMQNLWIIKPGAKSRGRGIKCMKRLDQILTSVDIDPKLPSKDKWVVQKYIEQPFLVHGTKFDVRQWFLVTDWNPLTVWFYNKCYLRFSTQLYSLDKLDSSVHLCNHSIQKSLSPAQQRHRGIPADNMWSDEQFRDFLASRGQEALWETVVVPGMKKALIHTLQTTQDATESRKNTFELFGADFVFGQDLHPWLIEINSSPTMAPSTTVTARLCAAVQKDTLRVILDRKRDCTANTGDFQLIYEQAAVEAPAYTGVNLRVEGLAVQRLCRLPPLGSSRHSAAKRNRKENAAAKKETSLLKVSVEKEALKNNKVPLHPTKIKLNLPTTVNKSSLSEKSHSESNWKRQADVKHVHLDSVQLSITEKYKVSLLQDATAPKLPRLAVKHFANA